MTLWSDLEFASLIAWTSARRATDDEALRARDFVHGSLKRDRILPLSGVPTTVGIARRLAERLQDLELEDWFGPGVALIPMPKSSLMEPATLWVPGRLVDAMVREGLGYRTRCALRRTHAVPKASMSSSAQEGRRPDVHFESLEVSRCLEAPDEVVIVDDIVTSGASLLGAAARVREVFPAARVRGFAVARTQSNAADFHRLSDTVVGRIWLRRNGLTKRIP